VHGALQLSAAAAVGSLATLLIDSGAASLALGIVTVGAAAVGFLAMQPRNVSWSLDCAARVLRRKPAATNPPKRSQVASSWLWTMVPLALSGVAFAVLLRDWQGTVSLLGVVGAYSLAWAVGFVAIPLPSGAGVREIVLVWMIDWVPPASVVAISVAHRVSTLAAELLLFAAAAPIVSRSAEST